MKSWKEEKIKKVVDVKSGYTWTSEQELNKPESGSIRVLTVSNIQDELDLSCELYLNNVSEEDKNVNKVSSGWTIAVSSNGNRDRIGNCVFIEDDSDYIFASFLDGFKPKHDAGLLPKYYYYWMKSYNVQKKISSVSEGTTGLGNMNLRHFRNSTINFPKDIREQEKIVFFLSSIDKNIEATKQVVSKAERLKKSLMQNLLTGKMKADGNYRAKSEFYIHEKCGKIPNGWDYQPIKKLLSATPDYGANASAEEYSPEKPRFIRITDIDEFWELLDEGKVSLDKSIAEDYLLNHNDFLIARTGDTVGKSLLYKKEMEICCFAGYLVRFIFDSSKLSPDYFKLIMDSDIFEAFKQNMMRTGAKPNINAREYSNFKIFYPKDVNEQLSTLKVFSKVYGIIKTKKTKIKILQRLKKSLMQNLLTGKVGVKI